MYDYYQKGWYFGVQATYVPDFDTRAQNLAWGIGLNDQRKGIKRTPQELEVSSDWKKAITTRTALRCIRMVEAQTKTGQAIQISLYWNGCEYFYGVALVGVPTKELYPEMLAAFQGTGLFPAL